MSLLKQPSFFMEPIGEEPIGAPGVPVPKDRLNRLIVGGGIGGLTAAIALRRNGHQVTLFDQTTFENETGAALMVGPNVSVILRQYGLLTEKYGGTEVNGYDFLRRNGGTEHIIEVGNDLKAGWQTPFHLIHRVELHKALREMSTEPDDGTGKGPPAVINIQCRVMQIHPEIGTVRVIGGLPGSDRLYQGDVILGADGVHSLCRTFLPKARRTKLYPTGSSAFTFVVSRDELLRDKEALRFVKNEGYIVMSKGDDRETVTFPCNRGSDMSCVAMHPSSSSDAPEGGYTHAGNKHDLLKAYEHYCPPLREVCKHADPLALTVWRLMDMDCLPTWVNGCLALLGDAAHPILPHQGQAGCQAIEDAASLGVVLGPGTSSSEIPARLKLYEQCRYERAHIIQHATRAYWKNHPALKSAMEMADLAPSGEWLEYNHNYNELKHSSERLQTWLKRTQLNADTALSSHPTAAP